MTDLVSDVVNSGLVIRTSPREMNTMPLRHCLVFTMVALTSSLVTGCAAPFCCCENGIGASLETRLGVGLGPSEVSSEWIVPDFVDVTNGLSEDEAITLGLWNNPAYRALLSDLDIAHADLIQASQLPNPQIDTVFPISAKQWEFALQVPLDAIVLRPHRVRAAQLESHRVAERLVQDGLNVVRDVRVAYVDLVLAEQQLEVAQRGERLRADIQRIAEARLRAGAVAELDVAPSRLEALSGRENAVRAAREVEIARERLRYLIGAALADCNVCPEPVSEPARQEFDVQQLVDEAVASRPDILAVQLAIESASEVAWLRQVDYLNVVGILPDINGEGQKGFEAGPGLQMLIPIFHQNQGARARALAELERFQRQYVNLCDTVAMEVRQSHARLVQSQERLRVWRDEVLPQARTAVEASRKALEEDGISLLLVLENTRQLLTAQQRELEVAAEVRRAIAELERSVGRRLQGELPTRAAGEQVTLPIPNAVEEIPR